MNDKVSVIMATKDTKDEYLDCAIKSILNQSYKNFEFIIINDGGNNYNLLKKYKDARIKIINHETSKGLPASLNEAIIKSNGKYIVRMDSDDISLPFRIEKQVKFMNANIDVDICGTYYKCFGSTNKFVLNVLNKPIEVKAQMFIRNVLAHPSVIIRKDFLLKNKLNYSETFKYSQDFELWTRSLQYGNIAILPEICLLYRRHSNQISSNKTNEQKTLYEEVLERNLKVLNIDKSYIKYLKMLNGSERIDYQQLFKFIQYSIKMNCNINCYNISAFKKILYNSFFLTALKNRRIDIIFNIKYINVIFNLYNIKYLIKKCCCLLEEIIKYKKHIRGVYIYDQKT